jgi:hypothetical protein
LSGPKKALAFDPNADLKVVPAIATPPAIPAKSQEARKQVGARIPDALYRQLKAHAALEGQLVQDLVELAIKQYLDAHFASEGRR